MRHITAGLLAVLCTACRDANAPVDWLSAIPGEWSGRLVFSWAGERDRYAFTCGTLRATIVAAPDGQLSGSWTLSGCGSYAGTLAGTITGQAVTLTLTTSGGSNLFQRVSGYNACSDTPVTVAGSTTGAILTDKYDGTPRLGLEAAASLSFLADPFPGFASPVCYVGSGVWWWYAGHT